MSAGAARGGTILLIEDEEDIATLVRTYLEKDGFSVIWAARGVEGLQELERNDIRLAILDLQLPDADGLDLCRAIRDRSRLPIVILTARDEEIDRIIGLELGADDYVAKPFGRPELLARIRAVLRRTAVAPTATAAERAQVLTFAGWRLDLRSRQLTDPGGAAVDLSGAEHDLLMVFLEHPGRVLGREQILEMSRGRLAAPSDRSVDTLVSRLRRKLEPPEGTLPVIKTVRGSGYMMAAKVERA